MDARAKRPFAVHAAVVLVAALLLAGCGDDGAGEPSPPRPSPSWPYAPTEPPPIDTPFVDATFLQELNHTTNELEPGVGPLVSVLLPPAGATGFESPTRVAPRGLVTHDGGGAAHIVELDAAEPDLIGAAFAGSTLVLAGPASLYLLQHVPSGTGDWVTVTAPAGLTIGGLASGTSQAYVWTDGGLAVVGSASTGSWPTAGEAVTAALEHGTSLTVAYADRVASYPLPTDASLGTPSWTAQGLSVGSVAALVANVSLPAPIDLVVVGDEGLRALTVSGASATVLDAPELADHRVPLDQPTAAARTSDGGFVVATQGGAYRIVERGLGPEWRVYNAERWLPAEQVRAVATDTAALDGPIYFATAAGLATVTAAPMTLEHKLESFVERVVLRHDRDGAVADSHLTTAGDLSTNIPWDSDNDGGWTCYWILAECFRHVVTGDPEARAHFDKSLDRMLRFRTLTGTEHFVARAVIRKEGCLLDDCDDPDDGEWFTSPDGAWWVKADTSNDEVTSHMFMMGHAHDLCADADQRARIVAHVDGIVGGLVDHGYQLLDLDGLVTTHGQFGPGYVNDSVAGQFGDGGRRSVQLLAALSLAYYLTGDERYVAAKHEMITEHHYDQNVITESEYAFRIGSGDGDELATQAFFVLLRYEHDAALREQWLEGWRRSYANMRLQQGALWDMVNAVLGGDVPDVALAGRWLQLAPMDMIRWSMHNSHRRDLVVPPEYYNQEGRMRSDGLIVPYDERPNDRWNTDQFKVDGGHGAGIEMDGADVLAPYWMGRYYGFIVPSR